MILSIRLKKFSNKTRLLKSNLPIWRVNMKERKNHNKPPGKAVQMPPRCMLRLALILAMSMALFANCMGSMAYDKTVSPGQWINLSGPVAPSGVTYTYEWHVKQSGSEVTPLKNDTSQNVAKNNQNLKFYAPWYNIDTVMTVDLLVYAKKTGGSDLTGCSQSAGQKMVLVQGPIDNDLTGDAGDHCTSVASTYTYIHDGPGITYLWYLGPININPATQTIPGYYTAGITPSSVVSRTSSININWETLVPSLKTSGGVTSVPPEQGTFTVTLKIYQDGLLGKTISKTVNLIPKPTPQVSILQ
jgi:hypothetical protein